jgi:hypothetical protein
MIFKIRIFWIIFTLVSLALPAWADPPPGEGRRLTEYGDTFEEPNWTYNDNNPKLYNQYHDPGSGWTNVIHNRHNPLGASANGRWQEGTVRGHPDIVEPVRTPRRGLRGSRYSLRLQTRNSGTPGRTEGTVQQDDLLQRLNGRSNLPLGNGLSVVTRIYLPKLKDWEKRQGYHIGFRVGASGHRTGGKAGSVDYWPGIWFWLQQDEDGDNDHFRLVLRSNNEGKDVMATEKKYTRTGWWTIGMTFNRDGSISYYASPGVDDLTEDDLLIFRQGSQSGVATYTPYNIMFDDLDYLFFSLANIDGEWSTEFIVDDVSVYAVE